MVKANIIKTVVSAVIIVILAVFVVNMNKAVPSKKVLDEKPLTSGEVVEEPLISEKVISGECFSDDPSTIVFVYSNSCPYCNNMKPIIQELENEGYRFYWAEGSDSEAREVINNCFSDIVGGYVPQFICPNTGKEQTGAMSKEMLKKFADDCSKI